LSFASNVAFNGTHQKIIYDVSRAFYDYSSARQRVAIAAPSKTEKRAHLLDAAQDHLKQGIGTTVEDSQDRQDACGGSGLRSPTPAQGEYSLSIRII
jgi:outer membrane protein